MLEITIDNCYKCDLETIIDPNNSQYFWINRRDLEIESKRNWQAIFDKCKDSSRQKYRKELTPNITFQPNKLFVRNDLFEKIIKSCEATNLEFLKLKEKLGLCLYDEQEFISTSDEIFTQNDVENKQLKEENEQLKEENEQLRKNNVVKDATIKEPIETPIEMKKKIKIRQIIILIGLTKTSLKKLAIIDSNKFNYKNKMGEFKYIDIRDLVNNIKNNTTSEISAKKGLNALNKIKNAEIIKNKKSTHKQKEFFNLFNDLLDVILTDETLTSSKDENENEDEV